MVENRFIDSLADLLRDRYVGALKDSTVNKLVAHSMELPMDASHPRSSAVGRGGFAGQCSQNVGCVAWRQY